MRYTTRISPEVKKFEEVTLEAFASFSRYGFRRLDSPLLLPQLEVHFRNDVTDLTLAYEIGSSPIANLGRLGLIDGKQYVVESYSFHFLLAERAPDKEWRCKCELDDPRLPAAIARQALLVERYAKDVLEGDFSIFPTLKLRAYREFLISHFSFLERYAFTLFSTDTVPENITVSFRSENVEVKIIYKLGSPPRVELGRLVSVEGRKEKVESYDLGSLLRERAPAQEYEVRRDDFLDPMMPYTVHWLKILIEQHALDVLQGDFTAFTR